ncbi:hypothetical protein C9J12_02910 [Photobacterium frigidiphilum]|uniref:Polysaccharide biosynthesis protein n=1 Tax=Photobacterium frigidiphilum TaxID=264736 RepID=A0A2T3JPF0_9GAMM|nr:oligosaccharide flippase family protein [Photobacterium frigidiphilum]PSU50933.1 hypothetical protein C9J12_02910 [Photobacterium frigidiphilum]
MKIAKDIILYLSVEVVSKSIPFAMLPFLTRALTPDEYAKITSFTAIAALLSILVGLNCQNAISALFYKDKKNIRVYLNSSFKFWLISVCIIVFCMFITYLTGCDSLLMLLMCSVFAFFWFPQSLFTTLMRLEGNTGTYAKFTISEVILNVSLTALLVSTYKAEGRIIAIVVSIIIFGIIAFLLLQHRYPSNGSQILRSSNSLVKSPIYKLSSNDTRLLKICLPVLPHLVSGWVRSGLDRYIVGAFFGMSLLGVYGVAGQLAMVMGVISNSVTLAIGPYVQRRISENYSKHKLVITTYMISFGLIIIGIVYVIFCDFFAIYLLGDKFESALDIVPYFVAAFCFQGISNLFIVYVYYSEKTTLLFKFAFPVGIVFILMQYFTASFMSFEYFKLLIVIQSLIYLFLIVFISRVSFKMPWFDFKGLVLAWKK